MKEKLLERFLRYVKVNTRSDANSEDIPTTPGQVELAKILEAQLQELGLTAIVYNEANGFLTACLPGNQPQAASIGLIAHLDTADFAAENIQPQVFQQYDGQDVCLNAQLGITLSVTEFPNLKEYVGETLVTTDGTTLLGADDKAGIVEILAAVEYFLENPQVKRGDVWLAFGPDEEIGRGADRFDAPNFPVVCAYTIDSGRVGHFEYETFNAAQALITIEGTSVHPGTAYGVMVNAIKLGEQIDQCLPPQEVPECTRGYEGFYLLNKFTGTIEKAELVYIIRDHDQTRFQQRKTFLQAQIAAINATLDKPRIQVTFQDQYYNMRAIIERDWRSVELAQAAMKRCGIEPIITPFRGGTDAQKFPLWGFRRLIYLLAERIFTVSTNLSL